MIMAHSRTSDYFSPDYKTARNRFCHAAESIGATLDELELDTRGPHDEPLTINVARFGASNPENVLLHTSGLHGVEGFAGGAIQLQMLAQPPWLPDSTAMILVHGINPYGMAWLRRFNEHNVDLNRNFLAPDEQYSDAPDGYHLLNELLNPSYPPGAMEFFWPRILWSIVRYGFGNLKQAVTQGQYEYPTGLFFGGQALEQSPVLLLGWLQQALQGVKRAIVLDIHTGLGSYDYDTLLVSYTPDTRRYQTLQEVLGDRLDSISDSTGIAYRFKGGFLDGLEQTFPRIDWTCACQEFGTLKPLQVLHALRQENRWHHYGHRERLDHPVKHRLLQAFCPEDERWRRAILTRGRALVDTAVSSLCS